MIDSSLLRFNDTQIYAGIDIESCNLNLILSNYPWQFSYVLFNKKEILDSKNYYINWGDKFKISKDAARITNYDSEVIKKEGKEPKEVYSEFRKILDNKDYKYVIHNGLGFDTLIEKFWCYEVGEQHNWDYLNRLYDTSVLAKAITKGFKPDLNNFLAWQYKVYSYREKGLKSNLNFLSKKYNINVNEVDLHNADIDIMVMMPIFLKQVWEIEIN